ncbi:MAG TPA: sugar nucleotide-binding protein [Gemmatimonadaceae bacterium]|nr:sugar nucleotide-binding protein [Gemmatimonadaceae bacterium]
MRVFVVGHRGMLGHVVARAVAERGHTVVTSSARYGGSPVDPLIEAIGSSGCAAILNCLGSVKRRESDLTELTTSNVMFPVHLAMRLRADQHLVHASTDCVFDGRRGGYSAEEATSAIDPYGFSKRLGEVIAARSNVTVMRVSVIGSDERPEGTGLLQWFLRQPTDVEIPGYTNWRWNGITTLEWASAALDLIERRQHGEFVPPIVQPGTAPISKYELLLVFREAYQTEHRIVPVEASTAIDRTLVPFEPRPPIFQQVTRMREWYRTPVAC